MSAKQNKRCLSTPPTHCEKIVELKMFVPHVGLHNKKNDSQNICMAHTHKLRRRLSTTEVAVDKQSSRRHARHPRHAQSCVQKLFFIIEVVK